MSYRNKTTEEVISDAAFQTRFASQGIAKKDDLKQLTELNKTGFFERMKLSFGGPEAREEIKRIEEREGTRGTLDVGDIADVAGAALPLAGAVAGGIATGGLGGQALGAAAGQGLRRTIGAFIGADKPTVGDVAKDTVITGVGTYVGGKILGGIYNMITKAVPNKLMSTIFKQSADDIALEVRSGGKNLVQSEEVLKEGFRGNTRAMMEQALNTMKDTDHQARGAVAGKMMNVDKRTIINTISEYLSGAKDIAKKFGFEPEIIKKGQALISGMKIAKGNNVPAEIVYDARKFIDSIRRTSSFKLNQKLSPLEAVFKNRADYLRKELAKQIPGFERIMNRYKIHIEAFEDLAKYAAKTENKDLFDLLDVFIMYGIDPSAYLARRGLTSATVKTGVAQGLYQAGQVLDKVVPSGIAPVAATQGIKNLFEQ